MNYLEKKLRALKSSNSYFKFILLVVLFLFISFLTAQSVSAASLFIAPSSGTYTASQEFSVVIKVGSSDQSINAAEGTLTFNPSELAVNSISKNGSIFSLWIQEPNFSNATGTVDFSGIIFNPGYKGNGGNLLTVNFHSKGASASQLSFSSGSVLANDGSGTNVLSSLDGASFVFQLTRNMPTLPPTPLPTVSPAAPSINLPVVRSTSHPDSNKWYSDSNPTFNWDLPVGVAGVSYIISDKPGSNSGPNSDGLFSEKTFENIKDGVWYFHIKFKESGKWGQIAHFRFQIDTVSPESFAIQRLNGTDPLNSQPKLSFETSDNLSGIDRYEMKIDFDDWFKVNPAPISVPYKMPVLNAGSHNILVKAFDRAGNSTVALLTIDVSPTSNKSGQNTTEGLEHYLQYLYKAFDSLINFSSKNIFFVGFLILLVGSLILIMKLLHHNIRKWFRTIRDARKKATEMKKIKIEEKISRKSLYNIINDIEKELDFLDIVDKRRNLGSDEKYLKTKLTQYLKSLKALDSYLE